MSDTVTIQVMDAAGLTAQATFLIPIQSAGGTLTLQQDGFPQSAPFAAVGVPYELGISVTNSANPMSWSVVSPVITASFINQSNTRTIFSWPSPTAIGGLVIQATDTVTLNTGTITLSI